MILLSKMKSNRYPMELPPDLLPSDKPLQSSASNVTLQEDGPNLMEKSELNMPLSAPKIAPSLIIKSMVLTPMVITRWFAKPPCMPA